MLTNHDAPVRGAGVRAAPGADLVIRPCVRTDLRRLEWAPELRADRALIEWVFERSTHGEMVMLVATLGGSRVGQIWVDFTRRPSTAVLWALRIRPRWQRRGIGTLLIAAGEREARRLGARCAQLAVEDHNPRARALYERLGYRWSSREDAVDAITGVRLGFDLEVLVRRLDGGAVVPPVPTVTDTPGRGARPAPSGTRRRSRPP